MSIDAVGLWLGRALMAGFAALVIADLKAGPLHDAALNGGDMLLVGEPDPLHMTREQRLRQTLRPVEIGGELE